MVSKTQLRALIVLGLVTWSGGACSQAQPRSSPTSRHAPALTLDAFRVRATNWFSRALLLKPLESGSEDLALKFAPLLVQELADTNSPASDERPGSVSFTNDPPRVQPASPAVYWGSETVSVNGREHVRFTYEWFYPARSDAAADSSRRQGVRITLDHEGLPAIWEVLSDSSGTDLVFVSRSVEAKALAEFRETAPARAFAVERPLAQAPRTVVARVIEDGPVPMGPIVYLARDTHDVTTVICRCMPSQASAVAETGMYQLLPSQAVRSRWNTEPLERRLWLPATF